MTLETGIRTQIAVLIYSMTNAVIFGAGLIFVLMVPALNADAGFWISAGVVASLILAAPFGWFVAPRLRAPTGDRSFWQCLQGWPAPQHATIERTDKLQAAAFLSRYHDYINQRQCPLWVFSGHFALHSMSAYPRKQIPRGM